MLQKQGFFSTLFLYRTQVIYLHCPQYGYVLDFRGNEHFPAVLGT